MILFPSVDSTKSRSMDIWKSQVHSGEKTISFHRETKKNSILRHTFLIMNLPPHKKKISHGLLVRGGAVLLRHQIMPAIVKKGRHLSCLQSLHCGVQGARSWGRGVSSPHLPNGLAGTLRYGMECDCCTPLGLWSHGCAGSPRRVVPQPVTLPDSVEWQWLQPHRTPLQKEKKGNTPLQRSIWAPQSGAWAAARTLTFTLASAGRTREGPGYRAVTVDGSWGNNKKKGQHKRNKSLGCLLPFSVLDVVRLHQHAKFQDTPLQWINRGSGHEQLLEHSPSGLGPGGPGDAAPPGVLVLSTGPWGCWVCRGCRGFLHLYWCLGK